MQRVLLVEKELVQVGKHAVEGAEEQDEESKKGVADGVMCAIVEDADGVENIQLVLPTSVSRQNNVRLVHGTRAERAGSVQIWHVYVLRARLPVVVGNHNW